MIDTKTNANEILGTLQNLISKSVEANTTILAESGRIMKGLMSNKLNIHDLKGLNTEVTQKAVTDLIKLNIKFTGELMDLGVNISRSFVSFLEKTSKPADPVYRTSEPPKNQLNLSVRQGQQASGSFYLNTQNSQSQTGRFYFDAFVDGSGGKKADLTMVLSPAAFTLYPGQNLKIDLQVAATNLVPPGEYTTAILLQGEASGKFDLVVQVLPSGQQDSPVKKAPRQSKKPRK